MYGPIMAKMNWKIAEIQRIFFLPYLFDDRERFIISWNKENKIDFDSIENT